jgi:hypothetical protein
VSTKRALIGIATAIAMAACTDDPSSLVHHSDEPGRDAGTGADVDWITDAGEQPDGRPDGAPDAMPDADSPEAPANPIVRENERRGTHEWMITQPASDHEVEGYASVTSAAPGEEVTLFVNVPAPHAVHLELYRLGFYDGLGGRSVATSTPLQTSPQPACPVDPSTGLVECSWKPTFKFTVKNGWVTGQYLVKLVRDDGFESYVPLTVREAIPRAPVVYQSSVNTWQAYNLWGGTSLYRNLLKDDVFSGSKAARVSFDRPYEYERPEIEGQPGIELGAGHLFLVETYMITWLEMRGYDVAYVTNIDVDRAPELLHGRKMFLDVGHDEYWSAGERAALDRARDDGVSLGFFSANDAYWHVLLDPSSGGASRRIVTCYKNGVDPKVGTPDETGKFRDEPQFGAEDKLIGQMYELWTNLDGFPLVVGDASHWAYAGTGLATGDTLPNIVGYEWDHAFTNDGSPSVEVIATSPVFSNTGVTGVANMTAYYPTSSSVVFSAGTISWAWGLGRPGFFDERVGKITENVLSRGGVPPAKPAHVDRAPDPSDVGDASEVTLVAGSGVPGDADGVGAEAQFNGPAGVAVDSAGVIYVTEARNHRVRKITPDGMVSTLAGCGPSDSNWGGYAEGRGSAACFSTPLGIVVGQDGAVYVADSGNQRIRAIDQAGNVTTYAGSGGTDKTNSTRLLSGIPFPRGLAATLTGDLYVTSDTGDIRLVSGDRVSTALRERKEASGLAVAPDGTVYVVSTGTGNVSMLQGGSLVPLVNDAQTFGAQSGPGAAAQLRPAEGLAVDGNRLYVSDSANNRIRRISLGADHTVSTLVGNGLAGTALGTGATARVTLPRGLALTRTGLIVADSGNHRILRVALPAR